MWLAMLEFSILLKDIWEDPFAIADPDESVLNPQAIQSVSAFQR
jgi:hypothetical protein